MLLRELLTEAKPENLNQPTLDKLFAAYEQKEGTHAEEKIENGLEVAQRLFAAVGAEYLIWTAKQYIQDQHFFLHDLPNWTTAFNKFNELKRKKSINIERNINSYQNIDQLNSTLQEILGGERLEGSDYYKRAILAINEYARRGEAKWLYRGNDYSIYQPLTYKSSHEWYNLIQGVTVCTVTNQRYFDNYSQHGVLIYIISQNGMYNCYIGTDGRKHSEFSDYKNDHDNYPFKWMLQNFPALRNIVATIKTEHSGFEVLWNYLTPDLDKKLLHKIFKHAIADDPRNIRYIPDEYLTPELGMAVMDEDPGYAHLIPQSILTYQLCKRMVAFEGSNLRHVPEAILNAHEDLSSTAVKENVTAIRYVPLKFQTEEMWKIAVKRNPGIYQHIDKTLALKYPKLAEAAVIRGNIHMIEYVPEELRTKQFFINISKFVGDDTGGYIPGKYYEDENFNNSILSNNWRMIYWMPRDKWTPERINQLVLKHPEFIYYTDESNKIFERLYPNTLKTLIKKEPNLLAQVPKAFRTEELVKVALEFDSMGVILQYIPKEVLTFEMCIMALDTNLRQIAEVPDKFMTPDLIKYVIDPVIERNDYWFYTSLPNGLLEKHPELVNYAARKDPDFMQRLKERLDDRISKLGYSNLELLNLVRTAVKDIRQTENPSEKI